MNVLDLARVVIYRYHEKGLEIFLIEPDLDKDPEVWKIPQGKLQAMAMSADGKTKLPVVIDLEPTQMENGQKVRTVAIEGDWHDIPSIRGIIKHDVRRVKNKLKEKVPGIEKGAYFAVKEAFKKVLPNEYSALKELKDILTDRNLTTYI